MSEVRRGGGGLEEEAGEGPEGDGAEAVGENVAEFKAAMVVHQEALEDFHERAVGNRSEDDDAKGQSESKMAGKSPASERDHATVETEVNQLINVGDPGDPAREVLGWRQGGPGDESTIGHENGPTNGDRPIQVGAKQKGG